MLKLNFKGRDTERGVTVVEVAVALPVLLLLTFGIIEFSYLVSSRTALILAGSEAVRRGSVASQGSGCEARTELIFDEEFGRVNIPHLLQIDSRKASHTTESAGGEIVPLIRLRISATSACILLCPFIGKTFTVEPLAVAEDPTC